MVRPNNEHRVLYARLVVYGQYLLTGGISFSGLMWWGNMGLVVILVLLYRALRSLSLPVLYVLPVPLMALLPVLAMTVPELARSTSEEIVSLDRTNSPLAGTISLVPAVPEVMVAALVPFRSSATPVLVARVKSLARFSVGVPDNLSFPEPEKTVPTPSVVVPSLMVSVWPEARFKVPALLVKVREVLVTANG